MIGDYNAGIDRIKVTEEKDMHPEEVRAWFIERAKAIGATNLEESPKQLKVRLYSHTGSTDFLTLVARSRYVEVFGSVASFLYGGGELLRYEDLPEALALLGNMLESRLRLARVDSIEITADVHLPERYEAYTPSIQAPSRMERRDIGGTIYIEGAKRKRKGGKSAPPNKRLKVYNKGTELGAPPEKGCLLRVELTLDGGASAIGRAIKAGDRVMITDLTAPDIWNALISQLTQSVSKAIQGQTKLADMDDMNADKRIFIAIAQEASKQGQPLEELPSVRAVMEELDKKARYRVKQKMRKITEQIQASAGGNQRAEELRVFIDAAQATSRVSEASE